MVKVPKDVDGITDDTHAWIRGYRADSRHSDGSIPEWLEKAHQRSGREHHVSSESHDDRL
jgi:hypothetical protein